MNIVLPLETLGGLKCAECECYLSRAPIYLKQSGESICGRCYTPRPSTSSSSSVEENDEKEEESESEKLYHEVAFEKLLRICKFPCMYTGEGCGEKQISFSDVEQHEKTCKFRPVRCLISSSGSCDWLGSEDKLYDHCVEKHPEQVLKQHLYKSQHDVTKSTLQSYIGKLYGILFLVHVNVCLTILKIYHSVQWVSGGRHNVTSDKQKFTLTTERGEEKLTKKGDILSYSQTKIHRDTSVACGINSLMEDLGGFTNTVFTTDLSNNLRITGDGSGGGSGCVGSKSTLKTNSNNNCIKCGLAEPALNGNNFCKKCEKMGYQLCRNISKGCKFSDTTRMVLYVHERSLCLNNIINHCLYCNDSIENPTIDSLLTHIETKHGLDWIRKENVYYHDLFLMWNFEYINWVSKIIDSQYGKFIFICDENTWKIRILSLENSSDGSVTELLTTSELKCTMFFKNKRNERKIIEKTFTNNEDAIGITQVFVSNYFHKVSFFKN